MPDLCPRRLHRFLQEIQTRAPHYYALMLGLTKENFYIFRDYDYAQKIDGLFDDEEGSLFTLQEFLDQYETFHPNDTFGIYFDAELGLQDEAEDYTSFDTTQETTIPSLRKHIDIFLEMFCEQQLRRNTPFDLGRAIIDRYGFTPDDVRKLQKSVALYNKAAKQRIRAEYDKLSKLDFIRNQEP